MKINLNAAGYVNPSNLSISANNKKPNGVDFGKVFSDVLGAVNESEKIAQANDVQLSIGNVDNVHELRIDSMKADLTLNFAIEVRNKLVQAYKELMRMQF